MRLGGHPVGVTCVHPGGIKTKIGYHTEGGAGFDATGFGQLFDHAAITSAHARLGSSCAPSTRTRRAFWSDPMPNSMTCWCG